MAIQNETTKVERLSDRLKIIKRTPAKEQLEKLEQKSALWKSQSSSTDCSRLKKISYW